MTGSEEKNALEKKTCNAKLVPKYYSQEKKKLDDEPGHNRLRRDREMTAPSIHCLRMILFAFQRRSGHYHRCSSESFFVQHSNNKTA